MKINPRNFVMVGGLLSLDILAVAEKKPNILFILSDDHSFPDLSCYGNPNVHTPNLDRLAQEGMLFQHVYTTASQSVPSRASFLTGRNVLDVDMLRFSNTLPGEHITFPEVLRKAGYYVGVLGRTYHLDGSDNKAPATSDIYIKSGLITFPQRFNYVAWGDVYNLIPKTAEFLDQVPDNTPFCLWANYYDPHRPWHAPDYQPDPGKITIPHNFPDTKGLREDLSAYYGEINRLDVCVGEYLEYLKVRGALDNTIIVFAGDNGAAILRGKGTLYNAGLNVPFIMHYPGKIKSGIVSDVLISGVDLAPTLLELTGVEKNSEIEGKSFVNVLKGSNKEYNDYIFAVRGTHGSGLPTGTASFDMSRTVFNKHYKLIYNALWQLPYEPVDFENEKFWKELIQLHKGGKLDSRFSKTTIFTKNRPMFEFYDLEKDPYEFENLAGNPEYKEIEYLLKHKLQEWMIHNRDVIPLPIPAPKRE